MGKAIIRPMQFWDIPTVAMILSTTEAWTCYGINYEIAKQLLEGMQDKSYVAVIGETIVGFITLRLDGVGNIGAYIRMVVVAESFRGEGIGVKMINHIAKIAFEETSNLFLICSIENTKDRAFYEKVGFNQVGILTDLVIKGHNEIFYRMTAGCLR